MHFDLPERLSSPPLKNANVFLIDIAFTRVCCVKRATFRSVAAFPSLSHPPLEMSEGDKQRLNSNLRQVS